MDLETQLRTYYDALTAGDPLDPFFAEDPVPVKFGITEALHGFEEVADGLREQTRTTTGWEITSHRLETATREDVGWFSDHVTMQWEDLHRDETIEWETRWSGTLVRRGDAWAFVRMHVSAVPDG